MVRVGKGGVFLFCVFFGHPNNQAAEHPRFLRSIWLPLPHPQKKGSGRWSTGGMLLLPPPRQGTPQSRKAAFISAYGAQASILSLGLLPGQTPLGAGGSEYAIGKKMLLNPRPQHGCLEEEILVPDCWIGHLKVTFFPPHKCQP